MDILIEQEKALHQHQTRQDIAQIKRLLHPTFQEVGQSGTHYDFASIVDMMINEAPSDVTIHSQDYQSILLEPSVHLLLYKTALVSPNGEIGGYAKRASIWAFTGSNWQMKYHQGTPCAPFELICE